MKRRCISFGTWRACEAVRGTGGVVFETVPLPPPFSSPLVQHHLIMLDARIYFCFLSNFLFFGVCVHLDALVAYIIYTNTAREREQEVEGVRHVEVRRVRETCALYLTAFLKSKKRNLTFYVIHRRAFFFLTFPLLFCNYSFAMWITRSVRSFPRLFNLLHFLYRWTLCTAFISRCRCCRIALPLLSSTHI